MLVHCYYRHSTILCLPHTATTAANTPKTLLRQTVKVKSVENMSSIWLESQEGSKQMLSPNLHVGTLEPPRECAKNEKLISEKELFL